jgi:hypothetical protein
MVSAQPLKVFVGTSDPAYARIVRLRAEAWCGVLPTLDALNDGHDSHSWHWTIFENEQLIASARLCVHADLVGVPDPHLYTATDFSISSPIGCFNRLVVSRDFRNRGAARRLDIARTEAAQLLGCGTVVIVWNYHSPKNRRSQIVNQGFRSVSHDEPVADGVFGISYPYAKSIELGVPTSEDSENFLFTLHQKHKGTPETVDPPECKYW